MDVRADYHETGIYERSDNEQRARYDTWKEDQNITDVQMTLLLRLEDLRGIPQEEKKKGNRTAETLLVFSMFFFLICVSLKQNTMLLIASIIVIVNTVIYLSGVTNPYSSAIRALKKQLKAYPDVVPFTKWCENHPN